ncbi:hypothetical protein [Spirillospora sp. NBC_01491]|nr:hypothetical protein [Spirillospora sp. NBC_01491]
MTWLHSYLSGWGLSLTVLGVTVASLTVQHIRTVSRRTRQPRPVTGA